MAIVKRTGCEANRRSPAAGKSYRNGSIDADGTGDVEFQKTAFIQGWAALLTGPGGGLVGLGAAIEESAIDAGQRRRLTPYGRIAFRCALGLTMRGDAAGVVFCSQHGDTHLTLELLQTQVTGELLSPTGFALSVHNAVAGLLDIGRQSHTGHVAISAGSQTLSAGMVEALLRLSERPDIPQLVLDLDMPPALGYPSDARTPDVSGFALRLSTVHTPDSLGQVTRSNNSDGAPDSGVTSRDLISMLAAYLDGKTGTPGIGWVAQGSKWKISIY